MSALPATAAAVTPPRSRNRAWGKFKRNHIAMLGLGIVAFFVLLAVLAPFIANHDPLQTSFTTIRKAPSASYWLGTDELGRDIFSRMVYGARASLMAGLVSVLIALVVGVPFGLAAGYFGGWTDSFISRATEALLAIPFLILAIALAAFLGPSLTNAMIAIGVSAAPKFVRLTRGQVLAVKNEDYVQSARALGASDLRIIGRHVFPNVMPPLIVQATITIATAIIAEASLSFLGLGLQPPTPSWGSMLNTAKDFVSQAPWMSIFPGIAIFLAVLGFNLLGDGLRDALDPRES
jgi:peptide/nickel transport system permease protein/oligopeptide transport system permease protein